MKPYKVFRCDDFLRYSAAFRWRRGDFMNTVGPWFYEIGDDPEYVPSPGYATREAAEDAARAAQASKPDGG